MIDKSSRSFSKRFPAYGWLGISIMLIAELLLLGGNALVATWFTPIMWTGYILSIDALVHRMKNSSLLTRNRREIPFLILISVGIWLLFEAFNLHLMNWVYFGFPDNIITRDIGYFWAFATIMPGVFVTIELFAAIFPKLGSLVTVPPESMQLNTIDRSSIVIGLAMVLFPLFLSSQVAAYFFGSIWLGFIFLLGPINKAIGARSAAGRWNMVSPSFILITLLAGLICGFLWETWNFQAFDAHGGYWRYTLPEPLEILELKFGMMPILGLLGFPPFAVELVIFYEFFRKILGGDRVFGVRQ